MSVRTELMENLEINKYQAQNLIKTYARNHNGKINVDQIVKDIQSIAKTMVHETGNIYNYDIKHEILECGKDRQYDGIRSLLSNKEMELADKYLANYYYENVDIWANTLYSSARKEVQSVLSSDIDSYRRFVDKLPFGNINKVSRTFGLESEVVEFLALNGEISDFQKFMTVVQPTRDRRKVERKSCPKNISIKLFEKVQESLDKNGMIEFNTGNIIRGLSTIYNNNNLDDMQKEELQNLYMSYSLRDAFDESLIKFSRTGRYEDLKEYINMQSETTWEEREAFLTQKVSFPIKQKMENEYKELLKNLKTKDKDELITPETVMEKLGESGLIKNGRNYVDIAVDEENKKTSLVITVAHPFVRGETMDIEIEGEELKNIIDEANSNSLDSANKTIESIMQNGMGEISVLNNWRTNERFRYESEDVVGALEEKEDAPYLIREEDIKLQVVVPYKEINYGENYANGMQIRTHKAHMTEEQIERFNCPSEYVEIGEHDYTYGEVDGYHSNTVYDFEINGERYHIENTEWSSVGGSYTVVKKGEQENGRTIAMGVSSSHSEWAVGQRGVNINHMIDFINKNPMRFSEYYEKIAKECDCCGRFPTPHVESICKNIFAMPTESELKKIKGLENVKYSDNKLKNVIEESKNLDEKIGQAERLLSEYEKQDPDQNKEGQTQGDN